MPGWLTTGQMIDKLKVGEVAEGFIRTENTEVKRMEVCKNDAHSIMTIKDWRVFEVNGITLNLEWRIIPNFISFNEAMKALQEGNQVNFHANNNYTYKIIPSMHFAALKNDNIMWRDLLDGRWTISEQK